jgi:hypothetical protein
MLARIDLARGHSEMLVSGPLNPWSDCGATALHQGDGVDLQSRVLCSISAAETPFDQGYNATMHQAMRDHASRDVREDSVHRAALDRDHGHPRPRQ